MPFIENSENIFRRNVFLERLIITDPSQDHLDHYENLLAVCASCIEHDWISFEQAETAIRRAHFAGLGKILPRDRAELYAFLSLVIVILQTIIATRSISAEPLARDDLKYVIETALDHEEPQTPPVIIITPPSEGK